MAEKIWGRCFDFTSPINICIPDNTVNSLIEITAKNVARDTDEMIYRKVLNVGVDVSKEELAKALRYDREQYEKGYADGLKNADIVHGKWIYKCSSERLGGTDATYDYKCSACNSLALEDSTYCPWCGALMDGERK